ncbi:MAG TPA: DUF4440 domain-containing protein [Pyrinomonadaceae bacterium]|nr:DUF4440 domain-containing protein [Pyrinomonadaceae bacterium]
MKKLLGVLVLTIAALSIALGQTPAKPKPDTKPVPDQTKPVPDQAIPVTEAKPVTDQAKPATEAKPAPDQTKPVGEAVAATPNAEQELIALDKSWGDAGLKGDSAVLESILADDFIGNSPIGVATKAQNIAEAKTNAANITNATYVADEYTVRFLDPNTAVMTHRATEKGLNKGKEYNDQHRSMHVWVKRDGRWQVVASQATPIPQK